jgi:integrase
MPITKIKGKVKDGLQAYRVRVNYTDHLTGEHKQIERTVYGKAEAQLMEHDLIIEMQGAGSATRMTFSDLVDEYLQAKRNDLRETTLDKKRRIFASTITPLLGKIRVDKLSPLQIQKWKDSIPSRLNVSTKQNYFKELRAVLRFAVLRGYIDRSPIERVENFRDTEFQSKPLSRVRYYTAEEFAAFIDVARQEAETKNTAMAWGVYVFFNVAFWSGLRKGEIHALKWSDLDDALKTIHVRRSLAQKLKVNLLGGFTADGFAGCGIFLMSRHTGDRVIKDDNCICTLIVNNVNKSGNTRMDKGGVADNRNQLFVELLSSYLGHTVSSTD